MGRVLRVWIPGYLPSANTALRGNPRNLTWIRKKARDEARKAWKNALLLQGGDPLAFERDIVVAFERRTCHPMDLRNLHAAYKALEDQLVEDGILPDDTSDVVVATPVRQVRVRKRHLQGTFVVVTNDRPEWAEARNCIEGIFEDAEVRDEDELHRSTDGAGRG